MSLLRKKIAEIKQMEDGKYVDDETGEVIDNYTGEKSSDQKLHDIMTQDVKNASSDFRDNKYYNKWGKVSPINILFNDSINDLYTMPVEQAKTTIINILEGLNAAYPNDKTFDYISKEYMNKIKLNLSKLKTTDKIVQYVTNMYFKGMGMSMTGSIDMETSLVLANANISLIKEN